jgi:hypothetical protein
MIGETNRAEDVFASVVSARFGLMPNFFRAAPAAPGLTEKLWVFARSAYLDSPLPAVFKERLFVHLSRFCRAKYCVVRHVGFLIGEGNPAGDPEAVPQSVDDALALLRRAVPGPVALSEALARLEARSTPIPLPAPAAELEGDLFDALAVVFLDPYGAGRALAALRRAVGETTAERVLALLAFVRAAHFWTETHPDLYFEPDMLVVMQRHKDLSRLLLDDADSTIDMARIVAAMPVD